MANSIILTLTAAVGNSGAFKYGHAFAPRQSGTEDNDGPRIEVLCYILCSLWEENLRKIFYYTPNSILSGSP